MIQVNTNYPNVLVFTHTDLDGAGAAYVIKDEYDNNLADEHWERNVEVECCGHSAQFNLSYFKNKTTQFIDTVKKTDENAKFIVFMLDYAILPNEDMVRFMNFVNEAGAEFYWCDHHMSAIENLRHYKIPGKQDNRYSGTLNTWKFLHGDEELPEVLQMIDDFDLWHIESSKKSWKTQVLPFYFFMESLGYDLNDNTGKFVTTMKSFMSDSNAIDKNISLIGKPIMNYEMIHAEKNAKNVYEREFQGMKCLVVNSLGKNTFEFESHPKFSEADLLIRWSFDGKKYRYSMYTCKDEIDVGEICSKYLNGGGHRKSAGGSSSKLIV